MNDLRINRLLDWIRTRFLGRAFARQPSATADEITENIEKWKSRANALLANDANWRLVRDSLTRLEGAGLRIRPNLDRDMIVVRFLRNTANWLEDDDLPTKFAEQKSGEGNTIDLVVFMDLADETDAFYDFEDIAVVLPKLSTLSDENLGDLIAEHSLSIFENAYTLNVVNEHGPGEFLAEHVGELESLACGDFTVQSVMETRETNLLVGRVTLSDGQSAAFEIGDEKRPDLDPLLKAMNSLIAHLNKGRFVAVVTGNSDSFIVVYLRPQEQVAFRDWSERQRFADGSAPGDWLQ